MDDPAEHGDVFAERRAKLAAWRDEGSAYPTQYQPRDEIGPLHDAYGALEAGQDSADVHRVAGRVIARRVHGKLTFVVLKDLSGEIQLFCQLDVLGDERYAALDQEELLDGVREALLRHDALEQVRVKSIATGLVDVLRLVFPAEQQAIQVGDVSAVGIDISTSSFGRSALHVRGMVWRLKCTNGLRVAERAGSYSFKHIGESKRLKDGLSDAIPSALLEARGVMGRWRQAVDVMVDDVHKMITEMRELSVGEKKIIVEELKHEAGVPELPEHTSLYNVLNAVTAAAHQASPARRLDMETYAGELLFNHVGRA